MIKGRFQPGQSGNPGGRPKLDNELRMLAKKKTPEAFEIACKLLHSDDESIRIRAVTTIFEYGYGKPRQELDVSFDQDTPLSVFLDRPLTPEEFADKFTKDKDGVESE